MSALVPAQAEDQLTREEFGPNTPWPRDNGFAGECENYRCDCGDACGCGIGCGCGSSTASIAPRGVDGYDAHNVALLSRVSIQEFEQELAIDILDGNDCWGYVSPTGREYALMGLDNAVAVVEITDPFDPVVVGAVEHPSSPWADVKTYDRYAYAVNESGGGVQVIDLTRVDEGVVSLANAPSFNGATSTSHNIAINEESGYAYLCGSGGFNGGLIALDLSDPVNPSLAGTYTDTYVHDAEIVTFKAGPNAGREIAFCYVGGRGLDIVDVTDKSNMYRVSRTTYSGLNYSHQGWLDANRSIIYLNDELDEIRDGVTTTTRVFDVASLEAPVQIGSFTTGLNAIDHNLYAADGFVFEANYRSGLRVFDATHDPVNPSEVGYFDTFIGPDAAEFDGAWSVYPFFPSGNVIVSDIQGGLFVLDPSFALVGGVPASISILTPPRDAVDPGSDVLRAQIAPVNASIVGFPQLVVDVGGEVVAVDMIEDADGVFEATFPPIACGESFSYYVRVETSAGVDVTEPLSAPLDAFTAIAAGDFLTGFADDFETDRGWIVGVPGDDAETGVWERAIPIGTDAAPGEDNPAGEGTYCFVTGNGASSGGLGDDDVDAGATTLTSPRIDATGAGVPFVEYARWFSNDRGANPDEDVMLVLISSNDGASWTLLETVDENANAWVEKRFRVSDFVEPSDRIRLRFVASDTGGGSIVEAGVDDARLRYAECSITCPADLSGNGAVSAEDLAIIIAGWGEQGSTDLDGSGATGAEDLAALIAAWGDCE